MKNKILITLALGLTSAISLKAVTTDIYITGSTAFRAQVYNACTHLFNPAPTINYGSAAIGGFSSGAKAGSWVMSGTPTNTLTAFNGDTLVIHGLFTGSIQGTYSVQNPTTAQLTFCALSAANNSTVSTAVTNAATIAFSDSSSVACNYPVDNVNYVEQQVAVQPFVIVKSTATNNAMNSVTNVTWDMLYSGIPLGYIPLSAWTFNATDTNTLIYLTQRTGDSGTRRTLTQDEQYSFGDQVTINLFDPTNNSWYSPTTYTNATYGDAANGAGVLGSEGPGNNNANMDTRWGFGYIGGGDIANAFTYNNSNNTSIAVLSVSDAQKIPSTATAGSYWSSVIALDGTYPTKFGAGFLVNQGNNTNDFSPVTRGYWPLWGYEVIIFPTGLTLNGAYIAGQDITPGQLGYNSSVKYGGNAGSFLGVFNSQSAVGSVPTPGSVENEIYLSETQSAYFPNVAIRLNEMLSSRQQVSGSITPF